MLYWYRNLTDLFEVPLVVIDTPFLYGEAQAHQIAYVQRQIEALVRVAERVAGTTFSQRRFMDVVRCARASGRAVAGDSQPFPASARADDRL